MRKNIYLSCNKKLDFYVQYYDNTAILNLNLYPDNYTYFGYIVIDILNDFYDMIEDKIIDNVDLINIMIFNNKKSKDVINIEILLEEYVDKGYFIEDISNMITNKCKIDKNNNYIISIPIKIYSNLILF